MDEEVQNLVRMLEEMHAKWKVLDSKSGLFERMSLELLDIDHRQHSASACGPAHGPHRTIIEACRVL